MLPTVLNEHQIYLFCFYFNECLQQGMRHGQSLYALAYRFEVDYRLEAYRFAAELAETGVSVILTVSKDDYKVWFNLQDLSAYGQAHRAIAAVLGHSSLNHSSNSLQSAI